MRKLTITLAVMLLAGAFSFQAAAQTTRGAADFSTQTQNFTPIEKAACGPYRDNACGKWRTRVCDRRGHCWCRPCG